MQITGYPMRGIVPRWKGGKVARDNYSYQKRSKELAKKKKKVEKIQRKLDKKSVQPEEGEAQVPNEKPEQSPDENASLA